MPPPAAKVSGLRHSISSVDDYKRNGSSILKVTPLDKIGETFHPDDFPRLADNKRSNLYRNIQAYEALIGSANNSSAGKMSGLPMSSLEPRNPARVHEDQMRLRYMQNPAPRDAIHKQSPIIASLRTNVIVSAATSPADQDLMQHKVNDEFTLVTDLSVHLAERYSRSDSGIMVTVDHSACLFLAGNFEPAYILTVSALPHEVQASANKINTAHLQSFLADVLGVAAERGVVRFEAIPEENLGTNGSTIQGTLERMYKAPIVEQRSNSLTNELARPLSRGNMSPRTSFSGPRRTTLPRIDALSLPESQHSSRSSVSLMSAVSESPESNEPSSPKTPSASTSAQPDMYDLSAPTHDIFEQSPNPSVFFNKHMQRSNSAHALRERSKSLSSASPQSQQWRSATFTSGTPVPEPHHPMLTTTRMKAPSPEPPPIKRERPQSFSRSKSFLSKLRRQSFFKSGAPPVPSVPPLP